MKKTHVFETWRSLADGQWYWHIKPIRGGKNVSNGEGYSKKSNIIRFTKSAKWINWNTTKLVILEEPI
jgi:hypothetical protein